MCETWLARVGHMTRSCATHDSCIREKWLIYTGDMTHSYGRHDSFIRETWLIHTVDMTHSYVRHYSFIRETWLIHTGGMTHSCGTHDSFMWETWLIYTGDMMHTYVWRDSLMRGTWGIHSWNDFVMLNIKWVSRLCHAQHQLGVTIVSCSTSTWCQCHAQHQLRQVALHVVTHAVQPPILRVLVCCVGVYVLLGGGVGLKRLVYLEELWLIPVRHVTWRTHLCMVVEALYILCLNIIVKKRKCRMSHVTCVRKGAHACDCVWYARERIGRLFQFCYGVATISRLLKIVGLFCRI